MLLYIIRHGDPDYEHNTITELGHREAKALAAWFNEQGIRFDEVYTSPLGRAKDTASYTCESQGITPNELPWTEESMDFMQPFLPNSDLSFRFGSNGIEEYCDFAKPERMERIHTLVEGSDAFLSKLGYTRNGSHYDITAHNNKRVAVFCHGGMGTAWTAHLLGMAPTLGFPSMFMTTTSFNVFEFRPHGDVTYTRPRMLRFGTTPHLQTSDFTDDRP